MARLFRVSTLNDRFNTHVFSFQIPPSIMKENIADVCSRDFTYGNQSWSISVVHSEKHVGVFLTLRNITTGMTCTMDYTFILVNKEHFTKNESYTQRAAVFTVEEVTHGKANFVGLPDLTNRGFIQDNGEFLLELDVRKVHTKFEQVYFSNINN